MKAMKYQKNEDVFFLTIEGVIRRGTVVNIEDGTYTIKEYGSEKTRSYYGDTQLFSSVDEILRHLKTEFAKWANGNVF